MRSSRMIQPPSSTTATTPRQWLRSASASAAATIFRAASRLSAFFCRSCACALGPRRTTAARARLQAIAFRIAISSSRFGKLPPRHLRDRGTGAVELRDDVHLIRCQLCRNRAHLLVDVVLAKALGECRKLALDIGRLLRLQLRRAKLMIARTVTGGTGRDSACGVSGKSQANGGVVFAKGMPGLKSLADKGRQSVGAAGEISPDIGRILPRERLRDRIHGTPRPLPGTKVVELLVDRRTIHPGQGRVETGLAHPLLAVAGGAIERDKRAVLGAAAGDLSERGAGPSNA